MTGRWYHRAAAAAVTMLAAAAGGASPELVAAAQAEETPIAVGTLEWGFKQSWRNYAGPGVPSDGATQDAAGITHWPLRDGTFDPVTRTTRLHFGGMLHFQSHWAPDEVLISPPPGYTGPTDIYLLDVTLANPQVTISAGEQMLTMEATGRNLSSWLMVNYGRVPVATLDITGITPAIGDGLTRWSAVPAFLAEPARTGVFMDQYEPAQPIDPVELWYEGSGAAPDLSEQWDPPGSTNLAQELDVPTGANQSNYGIWALDHDRMIVYYRYRNGPVGSPHLVYAFDLRTMTRLGEPLSFPSAPPAVAFVDSTTGRIFVRSAAGTVDTFYRWDTATGSMLSGTTGPVPLAGTNALWDPVQQRAISLERRLPAGAPAEDANFQWYLHAASEGAEGVWTDREYALPPGPAGLNSQWYVRTFPYSAGYTRAGAVLPDGSVLLTRSLTGAAVPEQVRLQRLAFSADEVTVTEPPGTDTTPSLGWDHVLANPVGDVSLLDTTGSPRVLNLRLVSGGALTATGEPVELGTMDAGGLAVDPVDGTAWVRGAATQDLAAVRDGRLRYRRFQPALHPQQTPMVVGDDHAVYSQTGTPSTVGGDPATFGFGRFRRLGFSPTVTGQPAAVTVTLPSAAGSAPVTLTAAANGDPAPAIRWQHKPAGATRFTDLDGAGDTTLTVEATAARNGTQYRAVFRNPAGAIASDPATLTVHYPPSISFPPAPVTVAAGEDASFQVQASGSPEPAIAWQRLVDGGWTDLPAGSAGHTGENSHTLTLRDVQPDQSGWQLRASVSNLAGTVVTEPVTLTVTGGGSEPGADQQQIGFSVPEAGPGELVWQIAGTGRTIALGVSENQGDHWYAAGDLLPITVTDTRTGGPGWAISGQASAFTGGVPGSYLGWSPVVSAPGGGAVAGPAVPAGWPQGSGLADPSVLASAPAGHALGTATIAAGVEVRLPATTAAGDYTATLTITAVG